MAIKLDAEPRMSGRAVIIKVSCPAIHAVACGTSNPKILIVNDNNVMPIHLACGCDVFATQQRRAGYKDLLLFCARGVGSKKILRWSASGYFYRASRSSGQTHISTSAPTRRVRVTARLNPAPTIANRPDRTGLPSGGETVMKLGAAIAEIMKREGIEILCGYPVNHLIEYAANADIRPVMVRQERIGVHMADAISRVTSGRSIGAFCMQHGPGAENAMGGVAQCYGESVPVLVLPMGYARRLANIDPNFNSSQAMKAFSKSSEPIILHREVGNIFRRAFTKLKNGRGGPVIVEIPADMWNEEVPEPLNYTPVLRTRYGADPLHVKEAAGLLVNAKRPVIYAGQGVHYAKAWPQLKRLAERLAIP